MVYKGIAIQKTKPTIEREPFPAYAQPLTCSIEITIKCTHAPAAPLSWKKVEQGLGEF